MISWNPPRGTVVVLAPHPDDETIGCGGVLRLHARRGDRVVVAFATDGERGAPPGGPSGGRLAAIRRLEARRACAVLGARALEFWGCPDARLASARGLALRVRELLARERPAVVYAPAADDPHADHRALARAVPAAARAWRYEIGSLPRPDAVADVSAAFEDKLRALREYRSQLRVADYAALVRRAGLCRSLWLDGCAAGEAFRLGSFGQPKQGSSTRGRSPVRK